ncbi:MAG TPA: glycosyltransferase family A protein [Polyangiaceae bacterium]|nr:glycosyltransferase family A protein [Polyangiaceae bacterium]
MTEIAVVAAVSRPERVGAVLQSFERQTHSDRVLVLVLNAAARDLPVTERDDVVAVRTEGGSPARARNAGLALVRALASLVAFWDDDDTYLPGYLSETVETLIAGGPRRVVGKHVRYVRFDDGLYCFHAEQDSWLGGTLGGWTETIPEFPDQHGEDRAWFFECERLGFERVTLSPLHFIYDRRSGSHVWRASRVVTLAAFGPAHGLGDVPDGVASAMPVGGELVSRPTIDDVERDLVEQQARRLGIVA